MALGYLAPNRRDRSIGLVGYVFHIKPETIDSFAPGCTDTIAFGKARRISLSLASPRAFINRNRLLSIVCVAIGQVQLSPFEPDGYLSRESIRNLPESSGSRMVEPGSVASRGMRRPKEVKSECTRFRNSYSFQRAPAAQAFPKTK